MGANIGYPQKPAEHVGCISLKLTVGNVTGDGPVGQFFVVIALRLKERKIAVAEKQLYKAVRRCAAAGNTA